MELFRETIRLPVRSTTIPLIDQPVSLV